MLTSHLNNGAWRDSIASWLSVCAVAEGGSAEKDCLRSLHQLLYSAPRDAIALIGRPPDDSELDKLLSVGAIESAAIRFVDRAPFGYLISQAFGGPALCTVSIPGSQYEAHFSSYSAALVRVGAVMQSVADLMGNGEMPNLSEKTHKKLT